MTELYYTSKVTWQWFLFKAGIILLHQSLETKLTLKGNENLFPETPTSALPTVSPAPLLLFFFPPLSAVLA